jgi:transcriptional regulator with XRE-family HTH domain
MHRQSGSEVAASLIAQLRDSGLSIAEIARRARLSRQTVWRFAEGRTRKPHYYAVERIQKLLPQDKR